MPEENWALIEGLCIILNVFLKATEKLSGEKYSTFAYAFPLPCHVLQHLGSQLFTPNSLDTDVQNFMKALGRKYFFQM
jgi:hypothetical protein